MKRKKILNDQKDVTLYSYEREYNYGDGNFEGQIAPSGKYRPAGTEGSPFYPDNPQDYGQ